MRLCKIIITACAIIIGISYIAQAQGDDYVWSWQHPRPQGNAFLDIHAIDGNTVIAVGLEGTIAKSTDNGENWDIQYYGNQSYMGSRNALGAVHFIDDNTGWAVGMFNSIIKTTDGGDNWELQYSDVNQSMLMAVDFADSEIGWAVGGYYIISTINGGEDWNLESSTDPINSVFFLDNTTGWMVGQNINSVTSMVKKTVNAGESWESTIIGTLVDSGVLYGVHFIDSDTGWVVGSLGINMPPMEYANGVIYKTTDGGESWELIYQGYHNIIVDVYFIDGMNGWIIGESGLLATTDGGESWELASSSLVNSISVVDESVAWIAGGYGEIMKTEDGGENWTSFSELATTSHFRDVAFINDSVGIAVGKNTDVIMRTTDGGENWAVQYSGNNELYLINVEFASDTDVWAMGFHGSLLYSDDGGITWELQDSPDVGNYRSMYFLNDSTGFIVTDSRILLKTTNGGEDWESIDLDANGELPVSGLWTVDFVDELHGWICGYYGIIITEDGGYTWEASNDGIADVILNDITFVNLQIGYAVEMNGHIYRTADGGDTWERASVPSNMPPLISINFVDENLGFACGGGGVVLKTTDGFIWEQEVTPTANDLYGIAATSGNFTWAVGVGGVIIKYGPNTVSIEDNYCSHAIPDKYALSENYPNPFNASTMIQYDLPASSEVTIDIYDILGRMVVSYSRGQQPAGKYQFIWKADDLSTGTYFYKLTAGNYSETRKMLLLK